MGFSLLADSTTLEARAVDVLSISLFGTLTLQCESHAPQRTHTLPPRSAALLGILALAAGRSIGRSELVQMLWEDEDRGGSAACLNTALWRLRKGIAVCSPSAGKVVVGDAREGLSLRIDAGVQVDVLEFQKHVLPALSRPVDVLGQDEIEELAKGVRVYRADLLANVSDHWAQRERERLRRCFLDALAQLMRHAALQGAFDEAIRRGQRILEMDPLREDIHRQLMGYFLQNGQRAHALRQFEHCRYLLKSELAISPMPETMALYQGIAQQALHSEGSAAHVPATTLLENDDREPLHQARQLLAETERKLHLLLG